MRTAMPSPVGRPESAIPCSPPTDPTGFIYPSYRAAQTETQRDMPSLEGPHQEVAYVSSSVGGSVSTLSFEENKTSNRLGPPKSHGRGTRSKVRGFSRASRRNLLLRLASINRSAFRAFKGRLISITLTYPHEYPEDPEVCKNHLKALRRRLQRKFGNFAGFWRLGIQNRGAWHFHLLLFVEPSTVPIGELRSFISASWYEVTGKVSEGHLRAGTRVVAVKRWREVTSYVERYMAKPEEFPDGLKTGRIWGIWNKELLPVPWETVQVSLRDAFKIRRIYRRLAKRNGSGSLRRITVFIRHENVVRLLEFLGYQLEGEDPIYAARAIFPHLAGGEVIVDARRTLGVRRFTSNLPGDFGLRATMGRLPEPDKAAR
jgi:hypothetical protein